MENNGTSEETPDAELLFRYVKGDVASMDTLVQRYRKPVFLWLSERTSCRSDAEDLFQEVWVRIIRNAGRFNNVSFRAWMWTITRNILIDFRRKQRAEVSLDETSDDDETPLVEQLPSPEAEPYRRAELADMSRRVMEAVSLLPEVQREVFFMRTRDNMSFNDIADKLGIPLNTALGRMHDAMTKLKRELATEGV
ncbi:MAG: sigma-70 family RNA polymerase sigma factor [Kiritimatiellae bacterium]|nr:sigma-70 family RNA polymerase sigma factor [Kiritimatiellia bacterium]